MLISEYIKHLERILKNHGDLEVQLSDCSRIRIDAPEPYVDRKAALRGRETRKRFVSHFYGKEAKERERGKVCRLF